MWSKILANEVGQFNITVNNILPGLTRTQRLESLIQNNAQKRNVSADVIEQEMKQEIPMKRFGDAAELAAVAAFSGFPGRLLCKWGKVFLWMEEKPEVYNFTDSPFTNKNYMTFQNTQAFAQVLDQQDELRSFRDQFIMPVIEGKQQIYFLSNSCGLQPKRTSTYLQQVLHKWANYGVEGFFYGRTALAGIPRSAYSTIVNHRRRIAA